MPLWMESLPSVGSTSLEEIDFERGAQRILQDVRQLLRLFRGEMAGDLAAAGFDRALNVRRGVQLAVQHNGQLPADVVAGDFGEPFCAIVVEPEFNLRLAQVAAHHHGAFYNVAGQAVLRPFSSPRHCSTGRRLAVRLAARRA